MEVVIAQDAAHIGTLATDAIEELVRRKPDAVLGLATGSSPLVVYEELGRRVAAGRLSLARCRAFMLDEYVGLPPEHPERYRTVIERELVERTDLRTELVLGLDGLAEDLPGVCADFEGAIRDAGGVDLQLLGIGTDGHVAFNEPGSSLGSRTRIKTLTSQTRADNARFFGGDLASVPIHCLTQGIGTIMEARHLVLIATGPAKAAAVQRLVEGPISAMCPASALQWHGHATVIVDREAASQLQFGEYYAETFQNKPAWQRL